MGVNNKLFLNLPNALAWGPRPSGGKGTYCLVCNGGEANCIQNSFEHGLWLDSTFIQVKRDRSVLMAVKPILEGGHCLEFLDLLWIGMTKST